MSPDAGAGRLFVSDIDGTLVTPDKELTPSAVRAAEDLLAAGVPFSVVSSRPPRGMRRIADALNITLPFAAFNGGAVVAPDGRLLIAHRLAPHAVHVALQVIEAAGVRPWVFADDAWLVRDLDGPNVGRERRTVGFDPEVVADFDAVADRVDKIVATSDDFASLDRVEAALRATAGHDANVERSQDYYVDVTHPLANKGEAVRAIAASAGADLSRTIVIGDMTNDIAMFRVAGFAIAMGQSPAPVKREADAVTSANSEEGFARAVAELVLPRLGASQEAPR